MATFSKKELETMTEVRDYLEPFIDKAMEHVSLTMNSIILVIQDISEKNRNILQDNIMGKQLLLNASDENKIYDILGIDRIELKKTIEKSEYFGTFANGLNLIDQLVFALPLEMLVGKLAAAKKEKEAKTLYTFLFYKPYASLISKYFLHGVNDDQMLYTLENSLSDKFDIKRLGSVYAMFQDKAENSYDNYITILKDNPKDSDLHIVFNSGIWSRINDTIKGVMGKYMENKGKYLPYESNTITSNDEDSEGETFDKVINSNSEVISDYANRAAQAMITKPVDENLLSLACILGFGKDKNTVRYMDMIRKTVLEASEKMYQDFLEFFSSIIGAFLMNSDVDNGKRYTSADIKTMTFFMYAQKMIFSSPHTMDSNIINARRLLNKMLEDYSVAYINSAGTTKGKIKKALYSYFLLVIQRS